MSAFKTSETDCDLKTFEPSPVTLGVVGAALALFAQLLGRAASLRKELDEFF